MRLICLCGNKGAGKNVAADALIEDGWLALSFADCLKDVCALLFCWPRVLLEGVTPESREWREQVDPWWSDKLGIPDFTPRYALTHVGTELFRAHFHPDIWISHMQRRIEQLPGGSRVVLVDGRFPNELDLARRLGGLVVGIQRGERPLWHAVALRANAGDAEAEQRLRQEFKVHASETAWIGQPLDAVLHNNSTRDLLGMQVRAVANHGTVRVAQV